MSTDVTPDREKMSAQGLQSASEKKSLRTYAALLGPSRGLITSGAILVILVILGGSVVSGFYTLTNLRSLLLSAALLGMVSLGQTLCALVGELDMSIAFMVGGGNVMFLWLTGIKALPSIVALIIILAFAIVVGTINGLISYRQKGQSIVVTLGVGTAILAAIEIFTTGDIKSGGTITAPVPSWLVQAGSPTGGTTGLGIAPAVLGWGVIIILALLFLARTWTGRSIYAQGGNPIAASRAMISQKVIWVVVFSISAIMACLAGIIMLGFSGGAFYDIGSPYLFTTVAAVVVGGTALAGGRGGYAQTVLGVAILSVLTVVLVGLNLSPAAQEMVLGMLLIPLVALYARGAHARTRI
jgi:ribose transport system permease protein